MNVNRLPARLRSQTGLPGCAVRQACSTTAVRRASSYRPRNDDNKWVFLQVLFFMYKKTKEREIKSLLKAGEFLKIDKLYIFTYDMEDTIETVSKVVKIIPVWKVTLLKSTFTLIELLSNI